MKKIYLILFLLFKVIFVFAQAGWTEINAIGFNQHGSVIPHERSGPSCFTIGNLFYYGSGGYSHGFSLTELNDYYSFSSTTHQWSGISSFAGQARYGAISFSDSINGYELLGYDDNGNMFSDNWKYNPVNDSWTQMNSFPGILRYDPFYFTTDKKLIFGCGRMNSLFLNDVWSFNPDSNSWTQKNNFNHTPVSQAFGFSINSLGYVCGGYDSLSTFIDSVYEYNFTNDSWTFVGNYPGTGIQSAFATTSFGYATSGNDFFQFNPVTHIWVGKESFPGTLIAAGVGLSNYGYIILQNSEVYEYSESNDDWQKVYDSPNGHSIFNSSYVAVGDTVYLGTWSYNYITDQWKSGSPFSATKWFWQFDDKAGGISQSGAFSIYNFSSNTSLPAAHAPLNPEISFIANGRYFAGVGYDSIFQFDNHLYEYDTLNDQWIQRALYPGLGSEYMMSFGIDSFGYAGGGLIGSSAGADDFWRYDPTTDQWFQKANLPGGNYAGGFNTTFHGKGFIGFASDGYQGAYSCSIYNYNPQLDIWTNVTSPISCRVNAFGFVAGDNLYTGSGSYRYTMAFTDYYCDAYKYSDGTTTIPYINQNEFAVSYEASLNSIIISNIKIHSYVSIYDLSGKKIISRKAYENELKISMNEFPSSIYFVEIDRFMKKVAVVK
jgi:N-acetylneuraminic acid mutarotase